MTKHAHLAGMALCLATILFVPLAHVSQAGQDKEPAKALEHMEVDLGGGVTIKLVKIEPGKFMMGSPKEEKGRDQFDMELQHDVEITKSFWMGVFEVTQEEYEKVLGHNPSIFWEGARLPVNNVSWESATKFCKLLSKTTGKTFDLPTEAEWEYACRAGVRTVFHYGDSVSHRANCDVDSDWLYGGGPQVQKDKRQNRDKGMPVGSYEANAFGLYDMHGNVAEWCKDRYGHSYYKKSPRQDPQGPGPPPPNIGEPRVVRGGSYYWLARNCRSASRAGLEPTTRDHYIGFRVVVRVP